MKKLSGIFWLLAIVAVFGGLKGLIFIFAIIFGIVSDFWEIILLSFSVPILMILFRKIDFPAFVYSISTLFLIIGVLGLLGFVSYSIFIEKIEEEIIHNLLIVCSISMALTFSRYNIHKQ